MNARLRTSRHDGDIGQSKNSQQNHAAENTDKRRAFVRRLRCSNPKDQWAYNPGEFHQAHLKLLSIRAAAQYGESLLVSVSTKQPTPPLANAVIHKFERYPHRERSKVTTDLRSPLNGRTSPKLNRHPMEDPHEQEQHHCCCNFPCRSCSAVGLRKCIEEEPKHSTWTIQCFSPCIRLGDAALSEARRGAGRSTVRLSAPGSRCLDRRVRTCALVELVSADGSRRSVVSRAGAR